VPWVESESLSFVARHEADDTEAAAAVLQELEEFRDELAGLFEHTPGEVAVVLHPRPFMLALAHPWLPLAQRSAAPAARRYFAGWFTADEIHVLSPAALERRAASIEGSREALRLAPAVLYASVVLGANNPDLPPPFTAGSFRRLARWAWLAQGAAQHFAGQVPHLRAAIALRLREGRAPAFPPARRDAPLLGGTVFDLLAREEGEAAAARLASMPLPADAHTALEKAFHGRALKHTDATWRAHLSRLAGAP
jgi:hypothetical protein